MSGQPANAAGQQGDRSWDALYAETAAALLAPRRLFPILLVCVPMVAAQGRFSASGEAVWVAAGMCLLFVATGPFGWRALLPRGRRTRWLPLRLLAYAALGGVAPLLGWLLPKALHMGETFLTGGVNLLISASLFWVGGWGLARDIDQEIGLRRAQARAEAAQREAERAQLLALRAQLDPHFLFNTLNAIAEWCRQDAAVAERALLRLAGLLRRVLEGVRAPTWPLARELDVARDLLELHSVRDPERFAARWELPDPLPAVEVPPLLLLPLVENAIKHGPAQGHSGSLALGVEREGAGWQVWVRNPGPFAGERDGGQGLEMVRRRLELAWPGLARLEIGTEGGSTLARVWLPQG